MGSVVDGKSLGGRPRVGRREGVEVGDWTYAEGEMGRELSSSQYEEDLNFKPVSDRGSFYQVRALFVSLSVVVIFHVLGLRFYQVLRMRLSIIESWVWICYL